MFYFYVLIIFYEINILIANFGAILDIMNSDLESSLKPIVVAHKVNRYSLLKKYLALGVPWLEIDVSMRNGVLVVEHGVEVNLGTVRAEIIKTGYKVLEHRDPLWRPLTLPAYLEKLNGKAGLWLDVKEAGAAVKAVELAKKSGLNKIAVSTPYHEELAGVKKTYPDVLTFLGNVSFRPADSAGLVEASGADGLSIEYCYVTREVVQAIHKAGLKIAAWTVNKIDEAKRMINLGVDFLITNVPEKVMPLIDESLAKRRSRLLALI